VALSEVYVDRPWRRPLNRAVALLGVVVIGARLDVRQGITLGIVLAAALAPVWWRTAWAVVGYRWLAVTTALAVGSGIWLTSLASQGHATNSTIAIRNSVLLVGVLVIVGFVIWARGHVSGPAVALVFGLAMLVTVPKTGAYAGNPWKFGYATPVTIVLLALAWWSGRRLVQVLVAIAVAAGSAINDGRSAFAILFLVACVLVWEGRPANASRRASGIRAVVFLLALGAAAYWLIQALILEGAFGEATEVRTQAQIERSGSVIVGGRPEMAAFTALLAHRPIGFGSGTILGSDDILVAKQGMAGIGYEPNNNYVEVYLFGGQIELHSVIGDLWAWAGFAGLALALVLSVLVASGTARTIGASTSCALLLFLAFRFAWDLMFSPFVSSAMNLELLLGLGLARGWVLTRAAPASRFTGEVGVDQLRALPTGARNSHA